MTNENVFCFGDFISLLLATFSTIWTLLKTSSPAEITICDLLLYLFLFLRDYLLALVL